MPKPEWGVKRTCPHCDARFYDLRREPIVCPECGTTYDVDAQGKVSATRERRAPAAVAATVDPLVDEEDLVEDEEADTQVDPLLDDEEEDEEPAGPALSDEDEEEGDTAAFQGPALIDDDEDEDEEDDVDLDEDDDDGDLGLDDVGDADDKV